MKKTVLLFTLTLSLLAGCKPTAPAPVATSDAASSAVRTYEARGIVRQIAPDRREATIQHQAIPGFMGAMTMDFTLIDTNDLQNISRGDEITFKLCVTETNSWIESVRLVAHVVESVTNGVFVFHAPSSELKPGDLLPDFTLTAEDGRPIRFSDYRGRVLAFTFFFTRCPLPDFCPRMDLNFAEARALLRAATPATNSWQFLSISFDPEHDLPDTLTNYAAYYRQQDADRWLFSVADTNTLARLRDGGAGLKRQVTMSASAARSAGGNASKALQKTGRIAADALSHTTFGVGDWAEADLDDARVSAVRWRKERLMAMRQRPTALRRNSVAVAAAAAQAVAVADGLAEPDECAPPTKPSATPWYKCRPALLSIFVYATTNLIYAVYEELVPLFASEAQAAGGRGGLGFSPGQLSYQASFSGVAVMLFAMFVYPAVQARWGCVHACTAGVFVGAAMCLLVPPARNALDAGGDWAAQGTLFAAGTVYGASFSLTQTSSQILVNIAAPDGQIGAVNGAGNMLGSVCRVVAPLLGGIMWSFASSRGGPALWFPFAMTSVIFTTVGVSFLFMGLSDDKLTAGTA